jgi:hypothetical protein
LSDLSHFDPRPKEGSAFLVAKLPARCERYVTFDDWQRIDAVEVGKGAARGKPREKLTTIEDMLAACEWNEDLQVG